MTTKTCVCIVNGIEVDLEYDCKLLPEDILDRVGILNKEGIRALRHYFVDEKRQRYWPLGWNEPIDSIENGDRFEIDYGPRARRETDGVR